jgi:predicted ATPase/class 3 adenylate cyclase
VPDLPTGTVTFLFTDIEGSTRLLQELGESYGAVQDRHVEIIRGILEAEEGREVRTEGDSFFAVFRTPARGLRAAVAAQRSLAQEAWPEGKPLRVRIGLHTGEGSLVGGDYIGLDVNRAARIADAAHGGQILVSDATRILVENALPEGVTVRDLGRHVLKDFDEPRPLYDLIIDGLPFDHPPIRTLGRSRRTNLPPPRTSFLGRQRELAEIRELFERTRLLTLTGPGGAGKTRLALRFAAEKLDEVDDGVYLVDLTAVRDPGLVPSTIAASLGVREQPGADLPETLAGYFRYRHLLLVLDNFEQVVEAAPVVGQFLDAAPRLCVLATSRVPLHLSGEHEFPVGPLPLPDPSESDGMESISASESVMLFVERAASVRRDFHLTEDNAPAVAEIARRLDGLPLAIELAAGRLKVFSPQALLDRLERRLPLLTGGARGSSERQRTLRGAIEWSHDLLEEEERRMFARLAVFRGGWSLESAEALCGQGLAMEVLDGLSSLVDKSLVHQEEFAAGDVRFRMLETIHEFAVERLAESGELQDLRTGHARHFRDLAEEAEPHLAGEGQDRWTDRLEQENENLRAALEWAEAVGDADTALRTGVAIWRFWQLSAQLAEGRARMERVLAIPGPEPRDALRARALGALGGICYWQNDYEAMRDAYEQAVRIARKVGERPLLARALFDLSFVPSALGEDRTRQKQLLDEALAETPEDDLMLRAEIGSFVGFLTAFTGGDPSSGIEAVETLIAAHLERRDRVHAAEQLFRLAGLKLLSRDTDAARAHLRESVALLGEMRSPVMLGMALAAASFVASYDGDHERAARLLGAGRRVQDDGAGGGPPPIFLRHFGDPEGAARAALGDEAFERAHMEGYAMTADQVRSYAIEAATG